MQSNQDIKSNNDSTHSSHTVTDTEEIAEIADAIEAMEMEPDKEIDIDGHEMILDDDTMEPQDEDENMELHGQEFVDDSIAAFFEHTEPVYSTAFHPNFSETKLIVTAGGDDVGYIWNSELNEIKHKLEGHTDTVLACGFNNDGSLVATGSMDGNVNVYNAETGRVKHVLDGPTEEIEFVSWHPRGSVVIAGCRDATMWMWNADNGKFMQVFTGHLGPVTCGSFTKNGKRAYSGSEDGSVFIWDPKTGQPKHHFKGGRSSLFHEGAITCVDDHGQHSIMVSGSVDRRVILSNYKKGNVLNVLGEHQDSVESVAFSSVQPLALSASLDGCVKTWDINRAILRAECRFDDEISIVHAEWFHESPLIGSACSDGAVRVVDGRNGEIVREFHGHTQALHALQISPDDRFIASCGDDCSLLLFAMQ